MCSEIIEEMIGACRSDFGRFGLLAGKGVECLQNGDVDGSAVI
jgi:hypothetical protein